MSDEGMSLPPEGKSSQAVEIPLLAEVPLSGAISLSAETPPLGAVFFFGAFR